MTLLNIDNNPTGDINPVINSMDTVLNPMAHATGGISPRAVGSPTTGKVTLKDSRIIANDGSNNIGLFGFDDAGNMVVKVAKAGFDANSASTEDLIFNSQQDTFKIVNKYPVSFTVTCNAYAGNNTLFSITHNLGYLPLYIASVDITTNTVGNVTGNYPLPYFQPAFSNSGTGNAIWGFLGFVTPYNIGTSTIQFEAGVGSDNASGQTLAGTVTVYVLQETAN